MGFLEDEANVAITRCGVDAALCVLIDSVSASQHARAYHSGNFSGHEVMDGCFDSVGVRRKARLMDESKKRKLYGSGAQGNRPPLVSSHDEEMPLPNPMLGFSLPGYMLRSVIRILPEQAIGPPFFYYENVALAPKGS